MAVRPLRVRLGPRAYALRFTSHPAQDLRRDWAGRTAGGAQAAVVADAGFAAAHPGWLEQAFGPTPTHLVPGGEGSKSVEALGAVWDFLAGSGVDRQGVVYAVGGGVVGDLAGFAAATWLRGVACVQVPTTLLAAVDSSVGGKTGINLAAGKNLAGAFHQPTAVWIAPGFLRTLPRREFAAGMAEVLKYGLLGDPALFSNLSRRPLTRPQDPRLPAVIRRCCAAKARVVEADEFEQAPSDGRALLNLGHTFGHAIERVTGYATYRHGEAVALGLVAAAALSVRLGRLKPPAAARISDAVRAHGLPVRLDPPWPVATLRSAMQGDKKARGGRLRLIVLERLGRARTLDGVAEADLEAAWLAIGAA